VPFFLDGLHPGVLWVIGGLIGLILEMLVPAFVIGSFGVSAFCAGFAAWLGASVAWQVVVFGLLGFLFVVPARRLLHRHAPRLRTGAETLPGKLGTCLEPIDGDLQTGVVQLNGARWTAIAERGTHIPAGLTVEVVTVDGAKLIVRRPSHPT
jgi:membrane protein implicated in regulation of membrane protease activity